MVARTNYVHDLAISAVSYDKLLVADLIPALTARLGAAPVWAGAEPLADVAVASPLHEDVSRVLLVLAQRLWGHDGLTSADAEAVRERVRRKPGSVVVVSLDDVPLPDWMEGLSTRPFAKAGIDGVVDFALEAIVAAGGTVPRAAESDSAIDLPAASRWPEAPRPFLGQPRAYSALRRELDALCAALEPRRAAVDIVDGAHAWELHKLPNRVVAYSDEVGVSFSWVPGRVGTVADGRLMVIEWSGIAQARGSAALRTARPLRECVYSAEATGSDDWRWRMDAPNGRASSTESLVGEWMAGATMTAEALAADVGR